MACDSKATANGLKISYVVEEDCGVIPADPQWQEFGVTGESIARSVTNTESAEIYADRNIRDNVQTAVEIGGGIDVEQRVHALEDFTVGALQADKTLKQSQPTVDIVVDGTDPAIATITDTGATGELGQFSIGEFVYITHVPEDGFVVVGKVIEVTDPDNIKVKAIDGTFADEVGVVIDIYSNYYTNGTTIKTFTIQKEFTDMATPAFFRFMGMQVSEMVIDASTGSILTGSYAFIGLESEEETTETPGATYLAPSTDQILNAIDSIGEILVDGVANPYDVLSMSLAINNNSRGQSAIGTDGFVGIAHGAAGVSGSLSVYFEDMQQYKDFVDQKHVALDYILKDHEGKFCIISMPNIKYTEMAVNATGTGADVVSDGSYTAMFDDSIGGTIRFTWLNG